MWKAIKIFGAGALLLWLALSFFGGDARYLKKTSGKLVRLASAPPAAGSLPDVAILRKVEKIARHIHFDIRFRAEFKGRAHEGKSLNEARSFLLAYFKRAGGAGQNKSGGALFETEDLTVRLLPRPSGQNQPGQNEAAAAAPGAKAPKRAETSFQIRFQRQGRFFKCRLIWGWIKEKKWRIKTAELSSCSEEASL